MQRPPAGGLHTLGTGKYVLSFPEPFYETARIFMVNQEHVRVAEKRIDDLSVEFEIIDEFERDEQLENIVALSTKPLDFSIDPHADRLEVRTMPFRKNVVLRHFAAVLSKPIVALRTHARFPELECALDAPPSSFVGLISI